MEKQRKHLTIAGSLTACLVFLALAPPAHARFAVRWHPRPLEVEVQAGESLTVLASLTAGRRLYDVSIVVGPRVRDFVTVQPEVIGNLRRGETVEFEVTVSPAVDAEPESVTAFLIPVARHRPHWPRWPVLRVGRLQIEVTWPSISHPSGEYAVTFPPELAGEALGEHGITRLVPTAAPDELDTPAVFVSVDQNAEGLATDEYYDGDPGPDLFGQSGELFELIEVGGTTAYRFDLMATLSGTVIVVVPRADDFVVVQDSGGAFQASGLFEAVLDGLEY